MKNIILEESVNYVKNQMGDELKDIKVERAVFGLFFSGIKLSNGIGGLCFTPVKALPQAVCCPSSAKAMPLSGKLTQRTVLQYLEDVFSDNVLKKTLGIATLNALADLCFKRNNDSNYTRQIDANAFDEINLTGASSAVIVGALIPMIKKLKTSNIPFHILEQDIRTLKDDELKYYVPAEKAADVIPTADVVVITGTTLINDTLPDLLALTKKDATVLVTGPTVPSIPHIFFKHGVTIIGGVSVTKPDELLDILTQAGSGYHFFNKSADRWVIKK